MEIASPRAPEYLCDPPIAHDPDHYAPNHAGGRRRASADRSARSRHVNNVLARYKRELGARSPEN